PIAAQSVMIQSTAAFWLAGRADRVGALLSRLARYTLLLSAPILLVIVVFAEPILGLYFGPDFVAAAWPLGLVAPGVSCFSLPRLVMPALQARGALGPLIAATLAATLADVALNLWLAPAWGAAGAALASSLAYTLAAAVSLRIIHGFGARP